MSNPSPVGVKVPPPLRPGAFIREHLSGMGEDHPSAIHRALREAYDTYYPRKRGRRRERRPPTFQSFLRYFHALVQLGMLEFTGREEPMEFSKQAKLPDLLQLRDGIKPAVVSGVCRYYRITGRGSIANAEWDNPYAFLKI